MTSGCFAATSRKTSLTPCTRSEYAASAITGAPTQYTERPFPPMTVNISSTSAEYCARHPGSRRGSLGEVLRVVGADDEDRDLGVVERHVVGAVLGPVHEVRRQQPAGDAGVEDGLHDSGGPGALAERRAERPGQRVAPDPESQRVVWIQRRAALLSGRSPGDGGTGRYRSRRAAATLVVVLERAGHGVRGARGEQHDREADDEAASPDAPPAGPTAARRDAFGVVSSDGMDQRLPIEGAGASVPAASAAAASSRV